jgi:hypothetical protein
MLFIRLRGRFFSFYLRIEIKVIRSYNYLKYIENSYHKEILAAATDRLRPSDYEAAGVWWGTRFGDGFVESNALRAEALNSE